MNYGIKKLFGSVVVGCLLLSSGASFAVKKGDWLIRAGVAHVSPNDKSTDLTGAAGVGVAVDSNLNYL